MNSHASMRPASGKTGRVWDIADQITRESGVLAQRKEVVKRFVAEGGNANTAATQYQFWKSAQSEAEAPSGKAFQEERERQRNVPPVRLTVGPDGRIVIPVEMRRAMQIGEAGIVTAEVREGALSVISPAVALERARHMVRLFDRGSGSVVDELIADRRAEAARE